MSEFNPSPHDRITIGGRAYTVMPHPSVPAFAFGQEGRKGFVYQLANGGDERKYALKKFKQAYRVPELVEVCDLLARFAEWPGLEVCDRQCLHQKTHKDALSEFPDLEYAVLMPWIEGATWYDILVGKRALSRLDALKMANATAQVLSALEESGLAHCDIAAPNVIIDVYNSQAHLIDVEDLYAPGFAPPSALPAGTAGYAHRAAGQGLWNPAADRFAGAVLLAEMASWHSAKIRQAADDEHYFDAGGMQIDSPRYRLMADALKDIDGQLVDLFERAWSSDTLEDCPRLNSWYSVLNEIFQKEYQQAQVAPIVSGWQPITLAVEPAQEAVPEAISAPPPITIPAQSAPKSIIPAPMVQRVPPRPLIAAKPAPQASQPGQITAPPPNNPVVEWVPLGTIPPSPAPAAQETTLEVEKLARPTLSVRIDQHRRPIVEWLYSGGADDYLLQESRSDTFADPKEYRIKAPKRLWVPSRMPWQRANRLYYRVRARQGGDVSEWSNVALAELG